jgi:hypothetical protein
LYINQQFVGLVEKARLSALPEDPKPGDGQGFVELSCWLADRGWRRLADMGTLFDDRAQWRLKIAGPAPWSFPELVLEAGLATPGKGGRLSVRVTWDRFRETARPWSLSPASRKPDVDLFR